MPSTAVDLYLRSGPLLAAVLSNTPLALVLGLSVVFGLVTVLVFRYTSNQQAIRRAKDQLKANLLAVRLFQDQLAVVLRSYSRILLGTGRYIRLAFTPLMFVIVPMVAVMVYVDHYLGSTPFRPEQPFLVQVRSRPGAGDDIGLQVPAEMAISAPPVHIPDNNEVVWRVVANHEGVYEVQVVTQGEAISKQVAVGEDVRKLSTTRLRNQLWTRLFVSTEPAIPAASSIESITVPYPERDVTLAGFKFNWIVLFFVFSLAAGWIFKTILRIEI